MFAFVSVITSNMIRDCGFGSIIIDTIDFDDIDNDSSVTYYDIACIPDYKTSVMMNSLFRDIKENRNLDFLEESDSEEEFEGF